MAEFALAFPVVLDHEGGLVDHPDDPGGLTNHGISFRYMRSKWQGNDLSLCDYLRGLSEAEAKDIYFAGWWQPMRLGEVDSQAIAAKVLDTGVNVGSVRAIRFLQRALNRLEVYLVVDGVMGTKTLTAVNYAVPEWVLAEYRVIQADHYRRLTVLRPSSRTFRTGWLTRAYS